MYVYINIYPPGMGWAVTVLYQTENDCKNNTVNNTNINDTVYNIDTAYNIYNMYIILIK